MSIIKQVTNFSFFIILGIIISCIFDIFRTLRVIKQKNSIYVVMIQDIIFFIIITIVSVFYIIAILDEDIRFYMLIALLIGIGISRKFISKFLIKIYKFIFSGIKNFIIFLCVPLQLIYSIVNKLIKKIVKKCCKLFSLVINLKCKLLSVFDNKNNFKKRGLENNEKTRDKGKRKHKKEKKIS